MSTESTGRDPHGKDIADTMSANEHSAGPLVTGDRRLWRFLILDAHVEDDPCWLIATIADAGDVRPAIMRRNRYQDWPLVTRWVQGRVGGQPQLVPVASMVWLIDA